MKFLIAILTFSSLTSVALAAPRLQVEFNPDPLFSAGNLTPGDEVRGEVTVTNLSDVSQQVITEAVNIDDPASFSRQINLQINPAGQAVIFNDDLADFFSGGEWLLAPLGAGVSQRFDFVARFKATDDNQWQRAALAFDLCVGFQGDESGLNCGGTTIGEEQGTGDSVVSAQNQPDDNGARGASQTTGRHLIITNEQVSRLDSSTAGALATINWQTNLLATSQVVYGLTAFGPYTLDLTAANFGYPFASLEDPIKVLDHAVTINNLVPGATYSYRVVSRASPPTISFERRFQVPVTGGPLALVLPPAPTNSSGSGEATAGADISDRRGSTALEDVVIEPGLDQETTGLALVAEQYPKLELPPPVLHYNNLAAAGLAFGAIPASAWWILLAVLMFIAAWAAFKRSRRSLDGGL